MISDAGDPSQSILYLVTAVIAGYMLGAVPFGLVLTRLAGYGDIRSIGSGNIGATNVLRTGNKPLALTTLLLDSGKGAVAVLLAAPFGAYTAMLAGIGALLGHLFPVWLGFRGGKGVATTLGTLLAYAWPVGAVACAGWLITALIFRLSSLAALVALTAAPLFAAWFYGWHTLAAEAALTARWSTPQFILALSASLLVWSKHGDNIRRLLAGTEPKIGAKGKKTAKEAA